MVIGLLHIFSILCAAFTCGKLISKLKLPAILGWLIAGIVFGPYLAGVVSSDIIDSVWYKIIIKLFECFAGVIVFFTVISIVSGTHGGNGASPLTIIGMVLLPFVIGIAFGLLTAVLIKAVTRNCICFCLLILFLLLSTISGLLIDCYIFHSFTLNYLLIGMAFSATAANLVPEEKLAETLKLYGPLLNLSLVIVIVNLGMPLDYRLIAGAGIFTIVYILSRAVGKIGGAYIGGKLTKAQPVVTKYLGFTLLPH